MSCAASPFGVLAPPTGGASRAHVATCAILRHISRDRVDHGHTVTPRTRRAIARGRPVVMRFALTPIAPREEPMHEKAFIDASLRARSRAPSRTGPSIELWRLRGQKDVLRGLVIETSFGYGLGLELDTELIMLFLQPNLDTLVAKADRIETALKAQGWRLITGGGSVPR
jgi:hypothetical protein